MTRGPLSAVLSRFSSHALVQTGVNLAGSGHCWGSVLMYTTGGTAGNLLGEAQRVQAVPVLAVRPAEPNAPPTAPPTVPSPPS